MADVKSFRLDRILTLGVAAPLRRLSMVPPRPALPVLMYHGICDDPEHGKRPYYRTNTNVAAFSAQMENLRKLGYLGMDLESALVRFRSHPGDRIFGITFDDGFRDFHTSAYPILRRCNFTATMYVPTGYIDDRRRLFKDRECLTWSEIRELRKAGIKFGSHTVTHPRLYELSWERIEQEVVDAKNTLELALGESATSFAYPYAFPEMDSQFVHRLELILSKAGFQSCVTTCIGRIAPNDGPFTLRRLPVNSCDDAPLLTAKLNGAYDWLAAPQRFRKRWNPRRLCSGTEAARPSGSCIERHPA